MTTRTPELVHELKPRTIHIARAAELDELAKRVELMTRLRARERTHAEQTGLELVPLLDRERAAFERLSRAVAALLNQ